MNGIDYGTDWRAVEQRMELAGEYFAACDRQKERAMTQWISVKDRLPEEDGLCLVSAATVDPELPFRTTAWYHVDSGWSAMLALFIPSITHWMPFPKAPAPTDPAVYDEDGEGNCMP